MLSADQCVALADLASRLETELAGPCFATFAFAGESLVLLQVATSGPADVPPGGELDSVWSRANVGESVPNVVSPLAWSLAEEFVEASIRRSLTGLGCSVPRGATLVANVSGRAYLNLSAVLAVAAQLPGVDPSAIVELAGTEGLEVIEKQARGVSGVSKRSFYARLPLTAARLLTEQTRLGFEVDGFCETVREARRTLGEIDLAILPDDALVPTLRDVRRLFDRTISVTSSATTAYALSHIALKTLLSRSLPVFAEHTTQVIVAGQALVSLRAARELASVAAVSLGDEPAHDALLGGSARAPLDLPEGLTRRALGRYLAEHGDLAISAAELAGPRWREDPSPVLAMLSSLARGAKRGLRTAPSARDRAERELDAVARRLPLLEQGLVRLLVERTRRFSELRERSHVAYMHVLAMLRGVALEVDRRLRRVDPTLPEGGAFFCTFEELLAALATGRPEVGHIVRLRLDEHALSQAMPDPPITFVGAPPPLVLPPTGHEVLRGVPASGGVGEGRARIIHSTDDLALVEHGEILVMKTADIARSPLFLLAGGIVTELGGPLTHGAVVARELSVPAVVHVVGAASGLRSGDRVRVDGDRGVVERVPGG